MSRRDRTSPARGNALSRRSALRQGLALLSLPLLARCAAEPPRTPPLKIALSELEGGARVRALVGSVPVEVRLEQGLPRARSLLCTHQGCEVSWEPGRQRYSCPCHEALFDAEGIPIEGPAHEPLREVQVWVEEDDAVILPLT